MDKKIIIIIGAIVLIALIIGGYFAWNKYQQTSKSKSLNEAVNTADKLNKAVTGGVLPSLSANPMENKPDLNPADKANPIKNIKTNPFD